MTGNFQNNCIAHIRDARHMSKAYRLRAEQLTKRERTMKAINLGILPFIILAASQTKNMNVLIFSLSVVGIMSLILWLWEIISMVQKFDTQLSISLELPIQADTYINELKNLIDNSDLDNLDELRKSQIKTITNKIVELRSIVEKNQVYVATWMNLMAQQYTMQKENAICSVCNRKWEQGIIFNSKKAKKTVKSIKKDEENINICHSCGQILQLKEK